MYTTNSTAKILSSQSSDDEQEKEITSPKAINASILSKVKSGLSNALTKSVLK